MARDSAASPRNLDHGSNVIKVTTAAKVLRNMREKHLRDNPDCPYGDQPHFVPPGFGMIGFYACQPPEDGRNHTRCRAPHDHEHEDHDGRRE